MHHTGHFGEEMGGREGGKGGRGTREERRGRKGTLRRRSKKKGTSGRRERARAPLGRREEGGHFEAGFPPGKSSRAITLNRSPLRLWKSHPNKLVTCDTII